MNILKPVLASYYFKYMFDDWKLLLVTLILFNKQLFEFHIEEEKWVIDDLSVIYVASYTYDHLVSYWWGLCNTLKEHNSKSCLL